MLTISENTGVVDVAIDPSNPDIVYAAAYQRRRHVFTLIDGGPESAIYKSTETLELPGTNSSRACLPFDMGRIGLAVSAVDPSVVYASIEAADGKGGIFRSYDWVRPGDGRMNSMWARNITLGSCRIRRMRTASL